MRVPWLSLATAAVTLVVAYLVFALLLGATVLGHAVRLRHSYLMIAASALVIGVGLVAARRRGHLPQHALYAIVLSTVSVLVSLVAVDTFFDLREKRQVAAALGDEFHDATIDSLRLRPPRFYPTPTFSWASSGTLASGPGPRSSPRLEPLSNA